METKLYAVSSGNGNDGVSHTFPDYYVKTTDPFRLATLALVDQFKSEHMAQALDECLVDGEADYTISAMLLDPLDEESDEQGGSWSDANGAYLIVEIFEDEGPNMSDPWHKPVYDCIEDCFSDEALKLVPAETE